MSTTQRPHLTKSHVVTLSCVGVFGEYWKAWRMSHPEKPVYAPSEERTIALLWWQEGLISDGEAWRMQEGRQVWQ